MKVATLASAAGFVLFGFGALVAIRLAAADTIARENTPASVAKAIDLQWPTPSAELEHALAEVDPLRARESLKNAVRDNPRSSAAWISLGLTAEECGDYEGAERFLRQAAFVDRQYLPAWTLTNFYFRLANREQFWTWAERSASLVYDDFTPLLRLCDQFEPAPASMLAHFSDAPKLLPSYLGLLIVENRLDAAQEVARAMAADRSNDPFLIDLADRQLRSRNAAAAIELWNIASGFPSIAPSEGRILTNGNLSRAPLNLGFDWRVGLNEGISQKWKPTELVFELSGTQPETCLILQQTIVLPAHRYLLRFDYMTGDQPASGILWALDNMEGPRIESSSQWRRGVFSLPRAHGLHTLKLFYRREPGTTRAKNRIEVRSLRLEAAP
jgi:tetratricopeptide (TPR) repeat protein